MRNTTLALLCLVIPILLNVSVASADDQHSVQAIRGALESPIPESALREARDFDDRLLQTGTSDGMRVYLVTDERLKRVQGILARLLTALGEHPQEWVVRVLDTDPKAVNAFVNGGKYVYVYTGLFDAIKSDDELAVILGHELGHSVLQHRIRAGHDPTSTLASLAALVGQFSGGKTRAMSATMYQTLHNGYSRDDEREADAFGALIAWRSRFDPIAGAAFFSRLQRTQDAHAAADATAENKELDDYKAQALVVKGRCETGKQQWASGQAAHTKQNADLINGWCASYEQARDVYSARIADDATHEPQQGTGDHPENQERVAAIAAETDFLRRARTFQSLSDYPSTQRVIAALVQARSPLVVSKPADSSQTAGNTGPAPTPPASTPNVPVAAAAPEPTSGAEHSSAPQSPTPARTKSAFLQRYNDLDDALERGVITRAEYDRKVAALLATRRDP